MSLRVILSCFSTSAKDNIALEFDVGPSDYCATQLYCEGGEWLRDGSEVAWPYVQELLKRDDVLTAIQTALEDYQSGESHEDYAEEMRWQIDCAQGRYGGRIA